MITVLRTWGVACVLLWQAHALQAQIYPASKPDQTGEGYSQTSGTQAERRPWDLSIRVGFQYSDNVPHVADGTLFFSGLDDTSSGLATQIGGVYRFVQNAEWEVGAALDLDGVAWFDTGEPNDWSFANLIPEIYVRKFFELLDRPAFVHAGYEFRQTWLRGDNFLQAHTLDASLTVQAMPNLFVDAGYAIAFRDFLEEFAEVEFQSRSGEVHLFHIEGTYWFDGRLRAVTAGYSYAIGDADGRNYEGDAHALRASLITHVTGPLWMKLEGVWTFENYDNGFVQPGTVVPPGREETQVQSYRVTFVYVIDERWSADVFYNYTIWDSNQSLFSGDENVVGAGITFKF